jgi:ubiquinone/menaquinone biosynthesis C-methylase UbiE
MRPAHEVDSRLLTQEYWTTTWRDRIDAYLAQPPRCGYWLRHVLPRASSILEIAGGSCRDSRHLAGLGHRTVGTDFDGSTIEYLRWRFPQAKLELQQEDAFSLSFDDSTFDASFSNGFWIIFSDDERLLELVREQARVTRRWLICLVHNSGNRRLVATFQKEAKRDPLYRVRFFSALELAGLIVRSGIRHRRVSMMKFGGPADWLYSSKMPSLVRKIAPFIVPFAYRCQPWSRTERIACIVELE